MSRRSAMQRSVPACSGPLAPARRWSLTGCSAPRHAWARLHGAQWPTHPTRLLPAANPCCRPACLVKVRRAADPAKALVRQFLTRWKGNPAVVGEESYAQLTAAIQQLGAFYQVGRGDGRRSHAAGGARSRPRWLRPQPGACGERVAVGSTSAGCPGAKGLHPGRNPAAAGQRAARATDPGGGPGGAGRAGCSRGGAAGSAGGQVAAALLLMCQNLLRRCPLWRASQHVPRLMGLSHQAALARPPLTPTTLLPALLLPNLLPCFSSSIHSFIASDPALKPGAGANLRELPVDALQLI